VQARLCWPPPSRHYVPAALPPQSLWVLDDNPRTQRFYEREEWKRDGGVRKEDVLGLRVTEVRYRIRLG